MEPDPGKIKNTGNIKQTFKRNKKYGSAKPAHAECANHTLNMLALLTREYNVFFSETLLFSFQATLLFH